jgi:acyl carrier protein
MNVEPKIRQFIALNILYSGDTFSYSDDASFIQEGIIDSMGWMELVAFLEKDFGVKALPQEITPENFDSVNRLAAFIRRKTQAGQPAASLPANPDKSA